MTFETTEVQLPIRFGPKTLFRLRFTAEVSMDHFADLFLPVQVPALRSELVLFSSVPAHVHDGRVLRFEAGRLYYSPKRFPRYLADLNSDFESYLNGFGSKSKSTLKRKVRKFYEAGKGSAEFREYRTPSELTEFHALARELSRRTYQEKLLGNGLPETVEFKAKMLSLAGHDNLRAYTLSAYGKVLAYLYCPARNGVLYYDFLGFDPEYSNLSPGAVLQVLAFESLFSEKRFRLFDFEEGEGQHKRQFATQCVQCTKLLVFKPGAKAITYIACNWIFEQGTALTLKLMDKLQVRRAIRKMLR